MSVIIAQTFKVDQQTASNVQEIASDHKSHEDQASDILCCHYGTLSQSLQYPVSVARLLHREQVISQTRLTIVKFTAQSFSDDEAIFLLLKAIRRAVHNKYHNLEVFANVLLKVTNNIPCANAILEEYSEYIFII